MHGCVHDKQPEIHCIPKVSENGKIMACQLPFNLCVGPDPKYRLFPVTQLALRWGRVGSYKGHPPPPLLAER
jgi:hypothetical protein